MRIYFENKLNYDIIADNDGNIAVYDSKEENVTENIKQITKELIIENIPTIINAVKIFDKYRKIESLQRQVDTLNKQTEIIREECRALLNGNI